MPTAADKNYQNYWMNFAIFYFYFRKREKTATIISDIQLNCEKPSFVIAVSFNCGRITLHPTVITADKISPTTTGFIPYNTLCTYLLVLNLSNSLVTTMIIINEGSTTAKSL